jgi:hypothetical protein
MRVTHTRPPTHKRRRQPAEGGSDTNKTERAQLSAQGRGCATLLRRLQEEHPEIVAHLQSLPDAQKVVDDAKARD